MNVSRALPTLLLSLACLAEPAAADGGRNYVHVVGSSTLLPYAEAVADRIAKGGKIKRPKLESTGAAGGFTLFCEGAGPDFPDIVNSPRPMKKAEEETCRNNGVGDIAEAKIGYDALAVAQSAQTLPLELTRKTLYLALAKQVPDPACNAEPACEKLVANPYKTWKQIDPKLPDAKIEVFGPPVGSGAGEVFAEAVLEKGCAAYPWLAAQKAKNEAAYRRLCDNVRSDGAYIEETGETVVSRIEENSKALGLVAFSRLRQNAALQALAIDGVTPSRESIAARQYSLAHPLYFYVKSAHMDRIPGLKQYVTEFTRDKTWGEKGYLAARGLIPLEASERKLLVAALTPGDIETPPAVAKRAPETRKARPSAKPAAK